MRSSIDHHLVKIEPTVSRRKHEWWLNAFFRFGLYNKTSDDTIFIFFSIYEQKKREKNDDDDEWMTECCVRLASVMNGKEETARERREKNKVAEKLIVHDGADKWVSEQQLNDFNIERLASTRSSFSLAEEDIPRTPLSPIIASR